MLLTFYFDPKIKENGQAAALDLKLPVPKACTQETLKDFKVFNVTQNFEAWRATCLHRPSNKLISSICAS